MASNTQRLLVGAVAGLAATVPMSAVMLIWHRRLPWRERGPLPPTKITHEALETVDVDDEVSDEIAAAATALSHFGYGAASGALYGLMADPPKTPPLASGVAFGLGVWAASYLGWLPATGWHRSALREPLNRNLLMITAHVVYGASLGLLTTVLSRTLSQEKTQWPNAMFAATTTTSRLPSPWPDACTSSIRSNAPSTPWPRSVPTVPAG